MNESVVLVTVANEDVVDVGHGTIPPDSADSMLRRRCDNRTGKRGSMLIPPILEVFVLWHPDDTTGQQVADTLLDHFRGTAFSGLIGGAVEVYARSAGWGAQGAPPRPLPFMEPLPNGLAAAAVTVVIPVLGTHLARAVQENDEWHEYLKAVASASDANPEVAVFGLKIDDAAMASNTRLAALFGSKQLLAQDGAAMCRDLAHSIAGTISGSPGHPLRVFISHTKRNSPDEEPDRVQKLVSLVRDVIGQTHLQPFFDEVDLQPGEKWEEELASAASTSGLLILRTDLFASREWCQREVLIAKRSDMPVVALLALLEGEERGSFLMDHVPSVSCDRRDLGEQRLAIETALNKMVDESLKRALWDHQRSQLESYGFDWLPANAPEPTTVAAWLRTVTKKVTPRDRLFVLHPDPPLGPAEMDALGDILGIGGIQGLVEILTPRTFASRGGQVKA